MSGPTHPETHSANQGASQYTIRDTLFRAGHVGNVFGSKIVEGKCLRGGLINVNYGCVKKLLFLHLFHHFKTGFFLLGLHLSMTGLLLLSLTEEKVVADFLREDCCCCWETFIM